MLASEYADNAGVGSFGYFSFALAGIPLVFGTLAIVLLFGERLLPHRSARAISKDFSNARRASPRIISQAGAKSRFRDGGDGATESF